MSSKLAKTDTREVYLIVEGPNFQWQVPFPAGSTSSVRSFVAYITTQGKQQHVAPPSYTELADLPPAKLTLTGRMDTSNARDKELRKEIKSGALCDRQGWRSDAGGHASEFMDSQADSQGTGESRQGPRASPLTFDSPTDDVLRRQTRFNQHPRRSR